MKTTIRFGLEVEDVTETQENLKNIYSQAHQDVFALGMNDYKINGTYVDIGCSMPRDCNNTYLLEKFGWVGINIDIRAFEKMWEEQRVNKFLPCDATKLDYDKLFSENFKTDLIDYLSFDVDAASNEVLPLIPFDKFRFNVITIEHDMYNGDPIYKNLQHQILSKNNYVLLAENVCVFEKHWVGIFEDWWVTPEIYERFKDISIDKKLNYNYSDEILNQLGLYINRELLLEKTKNFSKMKDISTKENLKALASDFLDEKKPHINLHQKPKIIYIDGDYLDLFFIQILPYINYRISILVNNNNDIDSKLEVFINDSRIINIFVRTTQVNSPKVKIIPNFRNDDILEDEIITEDKIIQNLNFRKNLSVIY